MTLETTTLHRFLDLLHDLFTMNKAVPSIKDEPRRMAGATGGNESTLLIGNDSKCVLQRPDDVFN